jgi:hypothetical protein
MHQPGIQDQFFTRRELLARCGMGMGAIALGSILGGAGMVSIARGQSATANINPLAVKAPPLAPRAKRVIHLFMNGGPSHVDTFDPKPKLAEFAGKALPTENLRTERKTGAAFASPFKFARYGQCGMDVSEIFPHVAQHVDELCLIRSMHADVPNHEPSLLLMNCGEARQIRPSVGSWITYGLGTENQNLPGFIVMCPGGYPIQESQNWQAGFLPGTFAGTYLDPQNKDLDKLIANVKPRFASTAEQRRQLDLLLRLNRKHQERRQADAQLESRIQSFELAYRMQMEASDAFDLDKEPQHVRAMYGEGIHARQLLYARRLVERGVRYVQCWSGQGQPWDNHDDIEVLHRNLARDWDQPIAGLLTDLKQRGMLEDTLVIWGGEFGRTPTVELPQPGSNAGKINGRDHNHYGFTTWLAGGGTKGGYIHGATDEFGFAAVENKVHVHDLHATMLYLLGFNHEKFTYRYAGRDFRLTDVHGNVVHQLIA